MFLCLCIYVCFSVCRPTYVCRHVRVTMCMPLSMIVCMTVCTYVSMSVRMRVSQLNGHPGHYNTNDLRASITMLSA